MLPSKAWLQSAAKDAAMLRWAINDFFPPAVRGPGGGRNGGSGGARTEDIAVGDNHPNPRGEHAAWVVSTRDAPSTGEGGAGVGNNDRRGAAIDVLSAMKDTEVEQGTEGGGKGGTGKVEPRTGDAIAMPPSLLPQLLRLRRKTNGGQGSSSLPMAPLQPRQ